MARQDIHYLRGLLRELRFAREAEWVEFKVDNENPTLVGEYISALANSAALVGKAHGYLVWGVEDETRALVGTRFSPRTAKKGNEPLETWLSRLLSPAVGFQFHELLLDDKRFVLLQVDGAAHRPIAFRGTEFLRVGSAKKKLRDFPEKERALWQTFSHIRFEEGVAAERLSADDVRLALNCPAHFDLLGQPAPDGRDATLETLAREKLIAPCDAGGFNITNLGAMLLAKDLGLPPARRPPRTVPCRGRGPPADLPEMLLRVPQVDGLDAPRQHLRHRVPDPHRAVADGYRRFAARHVRPPNGDGSGSESDDAALSIASSASRPALKMASKPSQDGGSYDVPAMVTLGGGGQCGVAGHGARRPVAHPRASVGSRPRRVRGRGRNCARLGRASGARRCRRVAPRRAGRTARWRQRR